MRGGSVIDEYLRLLSVLGMAGEKTSRAIIIAKFVDLAITKIISVVLSLIAFIILQCAV